MFPIIYIVKRSAIACVLSLIPLPRSSCVLLRNRKSLAGALGEKGMSMIVCYAVFPTEVQQLLCTEHCMYIALFPGADLPQVLGRKILLTTKFPECVHWK